MDRDLQDLIWSRAGAACEYCRMPQPFDELPFEIDHVVASTHGGKTISGNLGNAFVLYLQSVQGAESRGNRSADGPNVKAISSATSCVGSALPLGGSHLSRADAGWSSDNSRVAHQQLPACPLADTACVRRRFETRLTISVKKSIENLVHEIAM